MTKLKNFFQSKFFFFFFVGAICNLAFAPLHFFPAAIFSISAFYFLLNSETQKKRIFWLSWCYGFGYFLAGVYWIVISLLVDAEKFAWLIPFGLTLIPGILAIYFGLFGLCYQAFTTKLKLSQNHEKLLSFAIFWLIFEVFRSFLFTGFPWNLIGYTWSFSDKIIQSASIFGIWGLSFFAVLISLFPILFFKFEDKKLKPIAIDLPDIIFASTLFWLVIASLTFGNFHIDDQKIPEIENQKLRLVQGNIEQDMKWDAQQKYKNFTKHIELTNSENLSDISSVIWSETSVPYVIDAQSGLLEKINAAIPENGALVTGGLRLQYAENNQIANVWNSVFAIGKKAGKEQIIDSYDKHHLVPFGEYVPLQKYLPFIEKITDGAVGFSEGAGPKTIHTDSFSFSPLLCYEVIFTDKIIDKSNRPDLLINLTNDAWFGNSTGPYQHFDMAKMRAVEYGIPLARVANTGITAFFDPFGRVVKQINLNQEGIIDVNLVKNLEPTIYSRYSFYPLMLLILSLVIFLIRHQIK